eukprot:1187804-Prorocentrum_minimum.AAC.1
MVTGIATLGQPLRERPDLGLVLRELRQHVGPRSQLKVRKVEPRRHRAPHEAIQQNGNHIGAAVSSSATLLDDRSVPALGKAPNHTPARTTCCTFCPASTSAPRTVLVNTPLPGSISSTVIGSPR